METYIVLANFTQEGIARIKESPARVESAKKAIENAGGRWLGWFLTMGRYDVVSIFQAPDSETAARLMLALGALGKVRTETLRAFPESEFKDLLAKM